MFPMLNISPTGCTECTITPYFARMFGVPAANAVAMLLHQEPCETHKYAL